MDVSPPPPAPLSRTSELGGFGSRLPLQPQGPGSWPGNRAGGSERPGREPFVCLVDPIDPELKEGCWELGVSLRRGTPQSGSDFPLFLEAAKLSAPTPGPSFLLQTTSVLPTLFQTLPPTGPGRGPALPPCPLPKPPSQPASPHCPGLSHRSGCVGCLFF